MSEIINLRLERKAKARADKDRQAHDNRVRHGLSKTQKSIASLHNEIERKRLEGKTTRTDDD